MSDIGTWPHIPTSKGTIPSGEDAANPQGWTDNLSTIKTAVNSKLDNSGTVTSFPTVGADVPIGPKGTATAGNNYNSYDLYLSGSFWDGAAAKYRRFLTRSVVTATEYYLEIASRAEGSAETARWELVSDGTIRPSTNDTGSLGSSAKRVADIFVTTLDATEFGNHLIPQTNNTWDVGSSAKRVRKTWSVDADFSGTVNGGTFTSSTLTSPTIGTQITLDQTTADYTITWNDPGAARALTIPDPGGNDSFVFLAATQTLSNKTLTAPAINGTVTTTGLTLPAFTTGGNISAGSTSHDVGASGARFGSGFFTALNASGALTLGTDVTMGSTSNAQRIIKIITSTTGDGDINFSDTVNAVGLIRYSHNGDSMKFYTGNSQKATLNSTGLNLVGILDVDGTGTSTIAGQLKAAGLLSTGDPTATASTTGIGTTTGVGDGASTNLTAPAQGTGSGPATLAVNTWIRVSVGTTSGWVPFFV